MVRIMAPEMMVGHSISIRTDNLKMQLHNINALFNLCCLKVFRRINGAFLWK